MARWLPRIRKGPLIHRRRLTTDPCNKVIFARYFKNVRWRQRRDPSKKPDGAMLHEAHCSMDHRAWLPALQPTRCGYGHSAEIGGCSQDLYRDSPASMSILEEGTNLTEIPMMACSTTSSLRPARRAEQPHSALGRIAAPRSRRGVSEPRHQSAETLLVGVEL
jgi:hypothetical protein